MYEKLANRRPRSNRETAERLVGCVASDSSIWSFHTFVKRRFVIRMGMTAASSSIIG